MAGRGKRKIFLGVQEIAGMMERLNNAFRDMGIESDFYCMSDYAFADEEKAKEFPILKKFRIHTYKRIKAVGKTEENWWYFLQMWDILYIFLHVLFRYDEFIFVFGHGMFFYNKYLGKIAELEFWILKLFKKKMIMWLCGSDSRAPYCDVALHVYNLRADKIDKLYRETQKTSKKVKMLEKYMTLIDGTASSHFHTKPYINGEIIGVPVDDSEKVNNRNERNDKVVILHAPSNKKGKGTEFIRNILEEMRDEGYDFEYVEVSGLPHQKVLEKMVSADIVIDQVYCDTPMAGFASEAAINGIPAVVGGYYAEYYEDVLPELVESTIFCQPNEMKDKVKFLIDNKSEREKVGLREKEYIEKNCLANIVGEKFLLILDGRCPEKWLVNPDDNQYIWGIGVTKEMVIESVIGLVDKYGRDALCLNRNSVVYKKYMQIYEDANSYIN